MYLETINSPADVKKLGTEELTALAAEMREALIVRASRHMGHVGPDLGFIEATVALHAVFSSPEDKIIYDISHQTYPHKMLTGRREAYTDPAHYDDVSAYSSPKESPHDFFELGHTSVSIDLALGMAKARDLLGGTEKVVAVIGDGSLSGGEALEGLNTAGEFKGQFLILVNDNQMSIAENHGGLYASLKALRDSNGTSENNLFRAMGLDYRYEAAGNDIGALIRALNAVKDVDHPLVLHINTVKGKGYEPAETRKEEFHWHFPFDRESGETLPDFRFEGESYEEATAEFLLKAAAEDPAVLVLTSGVPGTIDLTLERRAMLGAQYLDVGIAEQTALAVASGAAKRGAKPVYFTEATFLQRAYDQLVHDVCIQRSPVTMLLGSASLFGMSDVTHSGVLALPMLSNIPELIVLAPTSVEEYLNMLRWSLKQRENPVVILIPSTELCHATGAVRENFSLPAHYEIVRRGGEAAILAPGDMQALGKKTAAVLEEKYGIRPTLMNPGVVSDLDEALLRDLRKEHRAVLVLEDGLLSGGFGAKVAGFYADSSMKVLLRGLPKAFYDRYRISSLLKAQGMTPEQLAESVVEAIGKN
mgnify:FL=1